MNQQIPPERRTPRPPVTDEYTDPRRREAEITRRREARARDVRKARIELALIGVGIIAALILIAVVIGAIVRSGRGAKDETDQTQTEDIAAVTTLSDTESVPETEPEPDNGITENTRILGSEIDSDYAIMIDLSTHEVLMTKRGEERIYPASMTKIMTLIVAYEHTASLEDTFEMTEEIVGTLWEENATVAGFLPGEKVRLDDLMYGLILPSGADCAVALAIHIAGGEEAFADLMNEKVAALGLKGTHFKNPTGLHDPDQYSTCHDIARILEYAASNEFMKKVLSTYQYTTHKTEQHPDGIDLESSMQQRMRGTEAPGMYVVGGKTGYTDEALNCLASFAVRCGKDKDQVTEADMEEMKEYQPQYIFVTAHGHGKFVPIFDAINAYALVVDENALETKQYSQR